MKSAVAIKHFFIFWLFATLLLPSACGERKKSGVIDGAYIVTKADSSADLKTILNKTSKLLANNKTDDAIKILTATMYRFSGAEKGCIMDQIGSAYFIKEDFARAATNYHHAIELSPDSPSYVINLSDTYEQMNNKPNASYFAQRILVMPAASDSDRTLAHQIIARCSQVHEHE